MILMSIFSTRSVKRAEFKPFLSPLIVASAVQLKSSLLRQFFHCLAVVDNCKSNFRGLLRFFIYQLVEDSVAVCFLQKVSIRIGDLD